MAQQINPLLHNRSFHEKMLHRNSKGMGVAAGVVIGAIVVIVVLGGAWAAGLVFGTTTVSVTQSTSSTGTGNTATGGNGQFINGEYAGGVNTAVTGYDHFGTGTTYSAPTNFGVTWYEKGTGSTYNQIGVNTQLIQISQADSGTIYAAVTIPSGQSYYPDPAATEISQCVTGWQYVNPTSNTAATPEFVFTVNLSSSCLTIGSSGTPTLTFAPRLMAQSTMTMSFSSSQSSSLVSFGTTPNNNVILAWYGTLATASTGVEITQVQIVANTTNLAVFGVNSINNPASYSNNGATNPSPIGLVGSSSIIPSASGSNEDYTYNIANKINDPSSGDFITYASGTINSFAFTTSVAVDFGAQTVTTGHITVEVIVYVLLPNGTPSAITNTQTLAENSS